MSEAKLLIKDLFKLRDRYDSNKAEFNMQTIDRRHGDYSIIIKFDNHEIKSSDDLYNYIVEKYKDLRNHSDIKEFRETEVDIINTGRFAKNKTRSIATFTVGYMDFELDIIKEVN
ncbi:MAG: hypothetical protein IJF92_00015 [Bacilli bacterium]|nr:hypothetical protein [Bacilli bacterium]MBQ3307626.1 hypothetical protein [Bacilli bacterium]